MTNERPLSRREFMRGALRALTLGGLGAGITVLIARPRETCVNAGICRGCAAYDDCGLPQALSAKQAKARAK